MSNAPQPVIDLLRASGPAHHHAYQHTNGDDPEWPLWYADYLYAGLQEGLGRTFTKSELVYWLVRADKEYKANAPNTDWPTYYAGLFTDHLGKD
jgi:hypothetical protein